MEATPCAATRKAWRGRSWTTARARGNGPSGCCGTPTISSFTRRFATCPGRQWRRWCRRCSASTRSSARAFLAEKSFDAAVDPLARIGNLYSGSLTAGLAFLLSDRYGALGAAIAGKRVLLASYGSGSTMVVMAGRVAEPARRRSFPAGTSPGWSARARNASFEEYEAWTTGPVQPELQARLMENARVPAGGIHAFRHPQGRLP